jgi:hypothetical protein
MWLPPRTEPAEGVGQPHLHLPRGSTSPEAEGGKGGSRSSISPAGASAVDPPAHAHWLTHPPPRTESAARERSPLRRQHSQRRLPFGAWVAAPSMPGPVSLPACRKYIYNPEWH